MVMLLRCALTASKQNHSLDEPFHISAAVALYESHKHIGDMTHPPIPFLVASVPLKLSGVQVPQLRGEVNALNFEQMGDVARVALFEQQNLNYWTILVRARLAMLIFPVIAMFYLYRLGAWLASPLGAMLAVAFFCTDPTLLAHAALVNNDAAACAGVLGALYHGLRWIVKRRRREAIIAGTAFALAMCMKFSALLVLPALGIFLGLRVIRMMRSGLVSAMRRRWPSFSQIALFGLTTFFVMWAAYFFNVGTLDQQNFFNYTDKWNQIPRWVRQTPIPMPTFFLGMIYQSVHMANGHMAYLNGQVSTQGWWYYFPETIVLKEPLAMLACMSVAMLAWIVAPQRRRPWMVTALGLPIAIWMITAMRGRVDIGIRHLLPILPLVYLLGCMVLIRARSIAMCSVVAGLIVVAMIETTSVHPRYLAYFNAIAGGPEKGSKYLLDSNLDWGQDIADIPQWLKSDPRAAGRVYTMRLNGCLVDSLLTELKLDPNRTTEWPPRGLFIVSEHLVNGLPRIAVDSSRLRDPSAPRDFTWLKSRQPVARIGSSIVVYDLDQPGAVASGD
jgi:hypothetical protein